MIFYDANPVSRRKQIEEYIQSNQSDHLVPTEISHISDCIESIYNWYEKGWSPGGFISAILNNDFSEACFRADETNLKALKIYAFFLHWEIPNDYKIKWKSSRERVKSPLEEK